MEEDFELYPSPEEAPQAPLSGSPEEEEEEASPEERSSGSTGAAGGTAVATRIATLAPRCDSRGRSVVRVGRGATVEEEGDSLAAPT